MIMIYDYVLENTFVSYFYTFYMFQALNSTISSPLATVKPSSVHLISTISTNEMFIV